MSRRTIPTVTGKKAEINRISALIEKGFSVFTPVVDLGIDAVEEKLSDKQPPKNFAFQVKTSAIHKSDCWYWYVDKEGFRCANNVYYVFEFEDTDKMPHEISKDPFFNACIVPSIEIDKHGHWTTYKGGQSFDVRITVNMFLPYFHFEVHEIIPYEKIKEITRALIKAQIAAAKK